MERLNAGGIDPILGGGGDEELLRAAADGLHREILRALRDTSDMSEMSSKVWGTCSRLAAEADAAAVRLQASATQDTPETPRVLATLNAPRACYEFRLETREDRSASENVEPDEHETIGSHVFTISPSALSQLAKLMRKAARRAELAFSAGESQWAAKLGAFMQSDSSFWDLTFCLLCRYDAMSGGPGAQGAGFHAAIPPPAFEALEKMNPGAAVKLECFASPLLCHGSWSYCSAFRDVDVLFGSLGPFLDEDIDIGKLGGVYEINPPFVRGVVLRLARKLLAALRKAQAEDRALCLFLVLPGLAQHSTLSSLSTSSTSSTCPSIPSDALDELLQSGFRTAFSGPTCRAFTSGWAFKTERRWPVFAVPTSLALFHAGAPEAEPDFERACAAWGQVEQDADTKKSSQAHEFTSLGPNQLPEIISCQHHCSRLAKAQDEAWKSRALDQIESISVASSSEVLSIRSDSPDPEGPKVPKANGPKGRKDLSRRHKERRAQAKAARAAERQPDDDSECASRCRCSHCSQSDLGDHGDLRFSTQGVLVDVEELQTCRRRHVPISSAVATQLTAGILPGDTRVLRSGRLARLSSANYALMRPGEASERVLTCGRAFFNFLLKRWQPMTRLVAYMPGRHVLYCAFTRKEDALFIKVGYRTLNGKRESIVNYIEKKTAKLRLTNVSGAGLFIMHLPQNHACFKDPARAAEESLKLAIRSSEQLQASPSGHHGEIGTFSSSLEYYFVKAQQGAVLPALTSVLRDFTGDQSLVPLRCVAALRRKRLLAWEAESAAGSLGSLGSLPLLPAGVMRSRCFGPFSRRASKRPKSLPPKRRRVRSCP
ncbi:unnamed protein product [Effrenium voratum]|nr:unnamed protein product [Effrenium voratum]